jgi:hypothetical protein
MHVHTSNWLVGIHFWHYAHDNECIRTHDAICDNFVIIAWDVNFHVGWEQLYALFLNMFNSFYQWVDIVHTKDGINTLVDVVVIDPTQANLFP